MHGRKKATDKDPGLHTRRCLRWWSLAPVATRRTRSKPNPINIRRFGGVMTLVAAKALNPMDSSAGNAINADALRRK